MKLKYNHPAAQLERPDKGFYFLAGRQYPRVKWIKDRNLRTLDLYCFLLVLVNVANGFDGSMMNGLQSLPYWQRYFQYPTGVKLSMFASAMSLGALIGLPFVPYMCDRLGRRMGAIIGSLIIILGVGLQAVPLNFDMFFAARMVLGIGMIVAYYLKLTLDGIGIKDSQDQLGINSGSKTMSLLVNIFVAFYIDSSGRRSRYLVIVRLKYCTRLS